MGAARGRTPVNCGYLRSLSVGGATRSITSTSVGNRSCRVWCGSAASLVVEDEIELCEIMGKALELSGYTVIGARDGKDALEKLDGLDGFVQQLRNRARFAAVPIIVHSSTAGPAPPRVRGQFSVGGMTRSITSTWIGARCGWSLSPSCSSSAVKSEGRSETAVAEAAGGGPPRPSS